MADRAPLTAREAAALEISADLATTSIRSCLFTRGPFRCLVKVRETFDGDSIASLTNSVKRISPRWGTGGGMGQAQITRSGGQTPSCVAQASVETGDSKPGTHDQDMNGESAR